MTKTKVTQIVLLTDIYSSFKMGNTKRIVFFPHKVQVNYNE